MFLFVLKEAKDHIIGKEKLGDTRAETKAKKAKPAPKRSTTINKAIEEGKDSFSLSPWYTHHCLFLYTPANEVQGGGGYIGFTMEHVFIGKNW